MSRLSVGYIIVDCHGAYLEQYLNDSEVVIYSDIASIKDNTIYTTDLICRVLWYGAATLIQHDPFHRHGVVYMDLAVNGNTLVLDTIYEQP